MRYFTAAYFEFFEKLAANNTREWFTANRPRFEANVKVPFETFVTDALNALADREPAYQDLTANQAIFRLHRDVRFSADKSPYKLGMSAVLSPRGKKSPVIECYVQLGPGESFFAGGMYAPDTEQLKRVRQSIIGEPERLPKLLSAKAFVGRFGGIQGEELKSAPRGMQEHVARAPLIRRKQLYFARPITRSQALGAGLIAEALKNYDAAEPVVHYLREAIGPEHRRR
ncbi:MAG: DUF2461 domain-containing protein [Clostridia bacterium]|nr:DUF2461 domain-containing protein [Deltaproteobacteria bacterium]